MNIRISGASEQNGDAAREVNRACNVKKLKNCIAAKAAQFLYEACAPYRRYGQGFKCSVCSSAVPHPVLTEKYTYEEEVL